MGALAAANKLMEGEVPNRPGVGFPDSLWTKMQECLELESDKRPTVDDVLELWRRPAGPDWSEGGWPDPTERNAARGAEDFSDNNSSWEVVDQAAPWKT